MAYMAYGLNTIGTSAASEVCSMSERALTDSLCIDRHATSSLNTSRVANTVAEAVLEVCRAAAGAGAYLNRIHCGTVYIRGGVYARCWTAVSV